MSNSSSGGIGIGTATIVFAILAYFVYGKSISVSELQGQCRKWLIGECSK